MSKTPAEKEQDLVILFGAVDVFQEQVNVHRTWAKASQKYLDVADHLPEPLKQRYRDMIAEIQRCQNTATAIATAITEYLKLAHESVRVFDELKAEVKALEDLEK